MVSAFRSDIDEHQPRRRTATQFAPLSVEERSYLEGHRLVEAVHSDGPADGVAYAAITMAGVVFLAGIAATAWVAMQ